MNSTCHKYAGKQYFYIRAACLWTFKPGPHVEEQAGSFCLNYCHILQAEDLRNKSHGPTCRRGNQQLVQADAVGAHQLQQQ